MVKLSEIELPVILEKKLLFGPGKWNDWNIESDEVLKSIDNTEWNKKTRSLFYSHEDDKAEKWVGSIANEFIKDGKVYGDLKICDADLAFKLTDGEAPFAVSAGIKWPAEHRDPIDFSYRNFSLVVNPGVHDEEIYINFADKKTKDTFNEATLIYTKANFESVEEPNEKTEEVKEEIKEKVEVKLTEESNLKSDERGLDANMVNEEKTTETIEEEKTEVKETKEEKVEEVKEEEKSESEETADADFSELKTKLDEAIDRIKILEVKQANFEEAKSEPETETETKEVEEVKEEEEDVEVKEDESESEEKSEDESKEEKTEEKEVVADFTKIANKLDRVADALEKRAAPMSTAEFAGTKSKKESVTDRLTSALKH